MSDERDFNTRPCSQIVKDQQEKTCLELKLNYPCQGCILVKMFGPNDKLV